MKFEDIRKGDIVFFFAPNYFTNLPPVIQTGVATYFLAADNETLVDVWMVNSDGAAIPVTPTSYKGLKRA